jgi:hypothetical protein
MAWTLIIAFVVIALVVLTALKSKQVGGGSTIGFPYQPAKVLFSPSERSFLGVLDQAVGADYRVFGKVRVADIAAVKSGLSKSARQGALNRIAQKHFDFVVCDARDLKVVCAIELNDSSHTSQRTQARDDLLVNVCRAINLPLLQVPARQSYVLQELRVEFLGAALANA